jgi:phage baseplate assembly protein W|tara:strand:+ start:1196 stop:1663 length:468 start_codon:yes stop_codon:yes gene_type:complete
MPTQRYGITFPFVDSSEGFFLGLNTDIDSEVRSNLVHLVLTRKGTRYFLPDFGTNLSSYVFEQMDNTTKISIDREIREAVNKYLPSLTINNVEVKTLEDLVAEEKNNEQNTDLSMDDGDMSFVGEAQRDYSMRVRIDYTSGDGVLESRDFVIIDL